MSQADQEKWDARYAKQGDADASAASEVADPGFGSTARIGRQGQQGSGCGLRWRPQQPLAGTPYGFEVDAVDVSAEGIWPWRNDVLPERMPTETTGDTPDPGQIRWIQADLDTGLPVTGRYDLILMIRYLDLALLEQAVQHLNPGGIMVVELHMDPGDEPDVAGPRNPNFLVTPGVLAAATSGLETLLLEEGVVADWTRPP